MLIHQPLVKINFDQNRLSKIYNCSFFVFPKYFATNCFETLRKYLLVFLAGKHSDNEECCYNSHQINVLTAVVVKTQSDDLKFCQADLKGYVFQNTDTERCFEFVYKLEDRLTWSDARDYCQVNGGRMINIEDQVKQSVLEFFLNSEKNPYKPDTKTYNPLTTKKETWGDYDPDVWIGAMRDSDGTTWRFDQFSTSRTVGSVIATWFNYGDDPVLLAEQEANRNKYTIDTCLMMRFSYRTLNNTSAEPIKVISYKWYQHQQCSNTQGHRHPFICEYIGYEYRETPSTSNWVIVIGVLGAFVGFGFLACTLYCLWDKIHTSYNVLQV